MLSEEAFQFSQMPGKAKGFYFPEILGLLVDREHMEKYMELLIMILEIPT